MRGRTNVRLTQSLIGINLSSIEHGQPEVSKFIKGITE
jgi:hypothetical protein